MNHDDQPSEDAARVTGEGEALEREGNRLMLSGGAIGVATVASAALLGATCPLCLVGVPAIIGYGLVQRVRGQRMQARSLCASASSPRPRTLTASPSDGETT